MVIVAVSNSNLLNKLKNKYRINGFLPSRDGVVALRLITVRMPPNSLGGCFAVHRRTEYKTGHRIVPTSPRNPRWQVHISRP
jgi:hypothetical protein